MKMKMPLDGCIERNVVFGGVLRDLPANLDPSDRIHLLRLVDNGKRDRILSSWNKSELRATLFLSIHNIKLCARSDKEDLLLRIPISQVAAVSYINDHNSHILVIIFGELDIQKQRRKSLVTDQLCSCHLAVMYCESRAGSEELCSLIDQCFQIIYTDATMHYFDRSLIDVARESSGLDPAIYGVQKSLLDDTQSSTSSLRRNVDDDLPQFLSHSSISVNSSSSSSSAISAPAVEMNQFSNETSTSARSRSSSEESQALGRTAHHGKTVSGDSGLVGPDGLSDAAKKLIFDYMNKLYNKLTPIELQKFSVLVKAWHTDMTFTDFCDGVAHLYGPDRTYLLAEMRPFIPAKDCTYFERFLRSVDQQLCGATSGIDKSTVGVNTSHIRTVWNSGSADIIQLPNSSHHMADDDNDISSNGYDDVA